MIEYTPHNIKEWTRCGMRKSFGLVMSEIVTEHPDAIVLSADVSSSAGLSEFSKNYPSNFYNIGIAEQNMIGVAAGLAKEGNNVFVTTFAPFAAMRPYEAIRTLVGYMGLNVKIIALASGVSLGTQGNTHFCFEDISLMRTIPGLKIFSPSDCIEMAKVLEYLANYEGPAYVRLTGIDGSNGIHKEDFEFDNESIETVRDGNDVAIIATGSIVSEAVRASRALARENISCGVYSVACLKPFNSVQLCHIIDEYKMLFTLEEHSIFGGLGSIVADDLSAMPSHPVLNKIGFRDEFPKEGNYSFLLAQHGLGAPQIRDLIIEKYKEDL